MQFITTRPLDCSINGSYAVSLDTALNLIMAWNPSDPDMSYHENNILEFVQTFAADGTCSLQEGKGHNLQYYIHGIFMWTAWALIGLL